MPDQNDNPQSGPAPNATPKQPFSGVTVVEEPTQPPAQPTDPGPLPVAPPFPEEAAVPPPPPPPSEPGAAGGSSAPPYDIPPAVITGTPKKKFGGGRVIATILGILLLVGGVGAGVILVRQQQELREKAALLNCVAEGGQCVPSNYTCTEGTISGTNCSSGKTCGFGSCTAPPVSPSPPSNYRCGVEVFDGKCVSSDWNCDGGVDGKATGCSSGQKCGLGNCTAPAPPPPGGPPSYCSISKRDPNSEGYCDRSAPNTPDCTDVKENSPCSIRQECGGGSGKCVVISQGGANAECQCQKGVAGAPPSSPSPSPTGAPPPGGGELTAQCLNILAYDTNWAQISNLSTLKADDKVRFTVSGTTSSGNIDLARFTITEGTVAKGPFNGVVSTRPGKPANTKEFYYEYTIPSGITSFKVKGELHHTDPSIGWF